MIIVIFMRVYIYNIIEEKKTSQKMMTPIYIMYS
jgi:hypothetical protein